MYRFLLIGIIFLFPNISFSQIDTLNNGQTLEIADSIKFQNIISIVNVDSTRIDSLKKERFFIVSLDSTDTRPAPNSAEYKSIKMIEAQTFVLTNGLKVILIQNDALPIVSYKLHFDYDKVLLGEKKGIELIFKKLWGENGKRYKKDLITKHKYISGTKIINDNKSIYIEGLRRYKSKNLKILSDLAFNFNYSKNDFIASKSEIIDSIYFSSNNNRTIVKNVARKLIFGAQNPIGETLEINNLDSLSYNDVSDYYKSFFNTSNAYLVVYGDISITELKRLVFKNFRKYRKKEVINRYFPQPYNLLQTEIDFVENYNNDSLSVWIGNVEDISSNKSNWFFNNTGVQLLFDKKHGLFQKQLLNSNTISDLEYNLKYDGKYFSTEYNVSADSVSKSIQKSIKALEYILNPNIDSTRLSKVKELIKTNYINNLSDPKQLSNLYLMYYLTGLDKYLIPNLMNVIDTMKYDDISKLLQNSIKPNKLRIVVSGQPQITVPQLEKLGIPINYYDQFAVKTFPPSLDRTVPDSVNVNDVIAKYINAIGGEENLDKVSKMLQWWKMDINDTELFLKNKYMLPNKRLSTYSNKDIIVLKTVFNGEYGYVEKSGKKSKIIGNEFLKLSLEKSIFPIRHYLNEGYLLTIESQLPLKGEESYKIRVEAPHGEIALLYFRISDGFLIKKEVIDIKTNDVISSYNYSDFKTFENIVFPYKVETKFKDQQYILTLNQIKINDKNIRNRNFK